MATQMIRTNGDGTKVQCSYPRSSFVTIFTLVDNSLAWAESNTKIYLGKEDKETLSSDIDSAINNVENLDLA